MKLFDLALKIVPEFDGNLNSLHRFLNAAEKVVNQFYDQENDNNFQNSVVINGIIAKLKGKALEIIDVTAVTTWPRIKEVLIQNFSDQRDENSLNRDLVNLYQGNESPQQFYDRCINLLTTLINYINIHNDDEQLISCKRDFFTAQALKTFLAGLKEPLGSTIRAMRPKSLPEALQYIKEEHNILYLQRRSQPQNAANNFKQQNQNPSQIFKQNPQRFSQNWFQPGPSNMNFNQNSGHNQQQNFFRPNFNQHQPSQNQQSKNYFYQDPRNTPKPKPVPMSGISYSNMPKNNNGPSFGPNNGPRFGSNNRPRFIPNPNFQRQQNNPGRPNYFQNVGHYPDFSFEELNLNETNNAEYFEESHDYNTDLYYPAENMYPDYIPSSSDETFQYKRLPETIVAPETRENENFHEALDQTEKT